MSLFSGTSQLKDIAGGNSHPLYSGMISGVDSRNGSGISPSGTLDYDYSYDYLWRLTEASLPGTDDWAEKGITYDRNGNLRSLTRHGGSGSVTDALSRRSILASALTPTVRGIL